MAYTFTRTGAQIEEIHNTVDDPKSNTQFSDDIRTIAGEYRGLWPDTGGSANKGDTYQTQVGGTPTGQYFTALQNTSVTPVGDDVNWKVAGTIGQQNISDYTDLVFDSVSDAVSSVASGLAPIGSKLRIEDYYGGETPNNSGVLFFKVVPAGTGIHDGGKYIDVDATRQLEQNLKKPYDFKAWGLSQSRTGAENDSSISSCLAYASEVVHVIIPNKIDQVKGGVRLPSGRYDYTAIDIPDGIIIEGDSATSSVLIDVGTDTSRPSIQVGGASREYNRCGLSKVGLLGAGLTNRNGVRFTKTYRMSGLFDCAIDGFYDNVVGDDFFAAAFVNNRIYSAVQDNFSIVNGTSTYWERNRIELAGRHNVSIDGQTAQEPINLSFNGDKIQSAGGSGINGVDVLSVELNGVFVESNNQLGGFNHVNFVGGSSANERGTILVSGGFITTGTGNTNSAALNIGNMKTVCLMPGFIRGGFDEGLRLGSDVDNAMIFGEIDGPTVQTVIPDSVEYIRALRGSRIEINGSQSQKQFVRVREVASNTQSQSLDRTVFINTSSNNVIYTIRTADFEQGREIKLQKISGDSNRVVIETEGGELVNDVTSFFTDEPYAQLTITVRTTSSCYAG